MDPSIDAGPPQPQDRPVGVAVTFAGARRPGRGPLRGRLCTLRPLDPGRDASELYRISHAPDGDPGIWTYLPDGPYPDQASFVAALEAEAVSADPLFFTVEVDGEPAGQVSFLSIVPEHGTVELGNIWFGPELRRTPAATEAILLLLLAEAFDGLGNRRVEWKCNALNAPSRRAAERLGFLYEGTFAQHRVVKAHNRDTAWFAVTDGRWPELRSAFERWLDPANFDTSGHQRHTLAALRAESR